ncbi:MAG TPA: creatininase family protein [Anaerolineaceae bacterium]|nr:creatininase family protein [Anaerolineaceae bacterium]
MRLEELNWMDVESYLEQDDRLMLITGACEQHGYLSLLTDVKIPAALADAASSQSGVPVAPPLNFGVSPYFLAYPGTISLRVSTFIEVVADMVRSVYGYGFRRLLFLNGHGGNDPARGRLTELVNELPGLQVGFYSWWTSHSVESVAVKHDLKRYHAGWLEAFPFTQVSELPEGSKIPPAFQGLPGAERARKLYGDGVFGGAYRVDDAVMQEIFTAALEDVLMLLKFDQE